MHEVAQHGIKNISKEFYADNINLLANSNLLYNNIQITNWHSNQLQKNKSNDNNELLTIHDQ